MSRSDNVLIPVLAVVTLFMGIAVGLFFSNHSSTIGTLTKYQQCRTLAISSNLNPSNLAVDGVSCDKWTAQITNDQEQWQTAQALFNASNEFYLEVYRQYGDQFPNAIQGEIVIVNDTTHNGAPRGGRGRHPDTEE